MGYAPRLRRGIERCHGRKPAELHRSDTMGSQLLKIGQLAKLTGVLPSTINFYTNVGLLSAAGRSQGGYRLYDPSAVQRVKLIRRLQEVRRLTISEIRQQLRGKTPPRGAP